MKFYNNLFTISQICLIKDMGTASEEGSSDMVSRKEFEEISDRYRKLEEIVFEQNEHLQSVATEILVHRDFLQKKFGKYIRAFFS